VFSISGQNFFVNQTGDKLGVSIDGVSLLPSSIVLTNCVPSTPPQDNCANGTFTINRSAYAVGLRTVIFKNPPPADQTPVSRSIVIGDPAVVTSANLAGFCVATTGQTLTLTGKNFFWLDNVNPNVIIGGTTISATPLSCSVNLGPRVQNCTQLRLTIPVTLHPSSPPFIFPTVSVQTVPIDTGCNSSSYSNLFALFPSATVTSVVPPVFCLPAGVNDTVLINGYFAYPVTPGATPIVYFAGIQSPSVTLTNCTIVSLIRVCYTLSARIPTSLTPGSIGITITLDGGCNTTTSGRFTGVQAISTSAITPPGFCIGSAPAHVDIIGAGFVSGEVVVSFNNGTNAFTPTTVIVRSSSLIETTWTPPLGIGVYDVNVSSTTSPCSAMLLGGLLVANPPTPIFADPSVMWTNMGKYQLTLLTSGQPSAVQNITLTRSTGSPNYFYGPGTHFYINNNPNEIVINMNTFNVGTQAFMVNGTYSVTICNIGCCTTQTGMLAFISNTDILLDSATPAIYMSGPFTEVTIKGRQSATLDLANGARFYLQPLPSLDLNAIPLTSSSFINSKTLTAFSKGDLTSLYPTLPTGTITVVAINPGTFATATIGTTTTRLSTVCPPRLMGAYPGPLEPGSTPQTVTLYGKCLSQQNWSPAANCFVKPFTGNPSLCCDPAAPTSVCPAYSITLKCYSSTGAERTNVLNNLFLAADANTIQFQPTISVLSAGDVCTVTLTYTEGYIQILKAAFALKTVDSKLPGWRGHTAMQQSRRGATMTAGDNGGNLYVIGGDYNWNFTSGNLWVPKNEYEIASVTDYGIVVQTAWTLVTNSLPRPLMWHQTAAWGRYVYLAGGWDGTTVRNEVYRALVMRISDMPQPDIGWTLSQSTFSTGIYSYRVAAVYSSSDTINPGEAVAGPPATILSPPVNVSIRLSWATVPNALQYKIYRSAAANSTSMVLLAIVSAPTTTYVDRGANSTNTSTPLGDGYLGKWVQVATLSSSRLGHAGCMLHTYPGSTKNVGSFISTAYLVIAFGKTTNPTASGGETGSWQFVKIIINDPTTPYTYQTHSWSNGQWTDTGSEGSGSARFWLGCYELTARNMPTYQAFRDHVLIFSPGYSTTDSSQLFQRESLNIQGTNNKETWDSDSGWQKQGFGFSPVATQGFYYEISGGAQSDYPYGNDITTSTSHIGTLGTIGPTTDNSIHSISGLADATGYQTKIDNRALYASVFAYSQFYVAGGVNGQTIIKTVQSLIV